jgi:hypothetical protein
MKLTSHFQTFMADVVDLNKTRITLLEDSVAAIKKVVSALEWDPKIISYESQGSWAHKTIIRPLPDREFDADLLVVIEAVSGWDAADYVDELYKKFSALETYKDKVRRYSHCITIEYAKERRIDLAPCIKGRLYPDKYEVCNRTTNEFESSSPIAYTDWVVARNAIAGGNDLRKATRLVKYLRDIKGNFTCPSFLLTTILGNQIYETDKGSSNFADLPTSLKTLLGRLDDWLQANSIAPIVRNPVLWDEVQSTGWNETKYSNFRDKINLYRGWIDEAYDEEDREESIGKWRRVFGDDFAPLDTTSTARSVSEAALVTFKAEADASGALDLVALVKQFGRRMVPSSLSRLPHVQRPKWRPASGVSVGVRVSARTYRGRYGPELAAVASAEPVLPGNWIRFDATNAMGVALPDGYLVEWRVTNTDKIAEAAKQLRGDFYTSDHDHARWENLQYRGVHFVEAFVVRKSDQRMVGHTAPFFVVIE